MIKRYTPTDKEWLDFRRKLKGIGDLPAEATEDRLKKLKEQAREAKE